MTKARRTILPWIAAWFVAHALGVVIGLRGVPEGLVFGVLLGRYALWEVPHD